MHESFGVSKCKNIGMKPNKTELLMVMSSADLSAVSEEIELLPAGFHNTSKGPVNFDAIAAKTVLADVANRKSDFVVDYEHQTLMGTEAPAAGWVTKVFCKADGSLWGAIKWTSKAIEYLKNREYRYISPVFLRDKNNRPVKFLHAALTNTPAIDGMTPVVAKDVPGGAAAEPNTEEVTMEEILKALGLPADASPADIVSAINALKTAGKQVACKAVLTALGLDETANESAVTGTIMAMKAGSSSVSELSAKVAELSGKLTKRDAEDLVQVAMSEGKILPGQKDWALDYAARDQEGFKVFAAKAPVQLQPGQLKLPAAAGKKADDLSDTELVICKQMGISKEDYIKANKEAN